METFDFDHVTAPKKSCVGQVVKICNAMEDNGNGTKRMMRCTISFCGSQSTVKLSQLFIYHLI